MRPLGLAEKSDLLREIALGGRRLRHSPRLSRDEMASWQLARIQELVAHAYETVPLYRELYSGVGFEPGDLRSFEDFRGLPLLSKDLLISCYPERA
ncbi:MAG: hypothetical protein ACRD1Z_15350, partial [Vicinamibacteria bacterium]